MNILYVSTLCSDEMFKRIYDNSDIKPQQQSQKFHSLLSKGLASSVKNVHVLTRPPVNKSTNKNFSSSLTEKNQNITYQYIKVVDNPLFKHLYMFFSGFINSIRWSIQNKGEERVIVCDILNLSISLSAYLVSKIFRIRNVAIVTDIPSYMQNYNTIKKSLIRRLITNLYTKMSQHFIKKYDAYTVLTNQMNLLINPKKNPSVVIEGMVDAGMIKVSNSLDEKYNEKVIIYAGSLKEKAGIRKLIEAFRRLDNDDARLWLYGSGEMEEDIVAYECDDNRIKYFGVVPNEIVVKEQLKATLLVNPRPSDEEFTKYSFPSKNMEYMVSGTPILTTPLPGMPKEYYDYVFLFEDETVEGMTKTLENILENPKEVLHSQGLMAKKFVIDKKNNILQAKKIIRMINLNYS